MGFAWVVHYYEAWNILKQNGEKYNKKNACMCHSDNTVEWQQRNVHKDRVSLRARAYQWVKPGKEEVVKHQLNKESWWVYSKCCILARSNCILFSKKFRVWLEETWCTTRGNWGWLRELSIQCVKLGSLIVEKGRAVAKCWVRCRDKFTKEKGKRKKTKKKEERKIMYEIWNIVVTLAGAWANMI